MTRNSLQDHNSHADDEILKAGQPAAVVEESKDDTIELDDLNANIIYFKNKEPYDHPNFIGSGSFPNQKVPLELLLKDDKARNPLMWDCEEDMIRYFHVPANNMAWIEVIASSLIATLKAC